MQEIDDEYPKCQHCPKVLVQAPDGTWVDLKNGDNICMYREQSGQTVRHKPLPKI